MKKSAELFSVDPADPPWIEDTVALIGRNKECWKWSLTASARPHVIPSEIVIEPFLSVPMTRSPGFELRAVAVGERPFAYSIPCENGWPVTLVKP